jgi:hypothetical protein
VSFGTPHDGYTVFECCVYRFDQAGALLPLPKVILYEWMHDIVKVLDGRQAGVCGRKPHVATEGRRENRTKDSHRLPLFFEVVSERFAPKLRELVGGSSVIRLPVGARLDVPEHGTTPNAKPKVLVGFAVVAPNEAGKLDRVDCVLRRSGATDDRDELAAEVIGPTTGGAFVAHHTHIHR